MAAVLGQPVDKLIAQRDAGDVPDAICDGRIVARSIVMDRPVTAEELAEHRRKRELEGVRELRRGLISAFFEAAGGTDNVARRVSMTRNALNICKHRGTLSRFRKFEFVTLAKSIDAALPDEIFNPIR